MSQEVFDRKLTAILSADVQGYSRLMRTDEDETVRRLTSYRRTIARHVVKYRGRVVDSPGDNLLAEFSSGLDAVNCAVEIQRELAERNEELPPERQMEFRIGVNSGDVIQEGDRIYGDGVNIAARVEGLAEGGGISISGTVYDSIEGKLGLEFEYQGEHEVKNIDKPIRVYRVLSYPGAAAHRVVTAKKAVGSFWRNVVLVMSAILIVGTGAVAFWHFYLRAPDVEPASVERMAYPLPEEPSIAVLPFDNMSRDPEQEYFTDGLTEEIITSLSKIPHMFVIARNSTFTYKGKPVKVQEVAEELGVRYVLEGSVRKSGDRVRITAQLIDALTGRHLWAERYDRELKDLFALQDDITLNILEALEVKLSPGSGQGLTEKGTKSLDAYLKVLEARECVYRGTKEGNIMRRKLSEEAIALDPEYPRAYLMLSASYLIDILYGTSESPQQSLKTAEELVKKALSLNDESAWGHAFLGRIYLTQRQYEKAIAEGERALSLDPNSDFVQAALAYTLRNVGKPERAVALMKRAIRLNPIPPPWYLGVLGSSYYALKRYKEAEETGEKMLDRAPDSLMAHLLLAAVYSEMGRQEDAKIQVAEILRIDPTFTLEHFPQAVLIRDQDEKRRYIDVLRKAGLPEKPPPPPVPVKPSIAVLPFANISGDPKEDYLSDGITEQIITALSKVPEMLVIARNSVFTYKGKPVMVQQVSEELGVRYVLEGSVQKSGDRLRVTAQLIDANTGNHIWSERYDRDLKELFELQDDITKNVITALQVELTEGETARLYGKGTKNLEAYLKMMKGLHHHFFYNKDDNETARRFFEEAITLDPNYANAYVRWAWTFWQEASSGWTNSTWESYEKAIELAKKAITLDEQHAGAYMVLANVYAKTGQFEKSMAAAKKGLSLDPASSYIIAEYGLTLYNLGQFKEAIPFFEKAIRMDPKPQTWSLGMLGASYYKMGKFKDAISFLEKAISIDQEPPSWCLALLGESYYEIDKDKEAITFLKEAIRIDPKPPSWYTVVLRNSYCRMGISYYETGSFKESIPFLKEAIRLTPTPSSWHLELLGASYYKMGKLDESIPFLKEAISLWRDNLDAHVVLAAAYSLTGRMEDARAQAAEVLEINPQFSLEDIAKKTYYDFLGDDKERFINALRKSGLE